MEPQTGIAKSLGNIFEDLGLPDAPVLTLKAKLAAQISLALEARDWNQNRAAAELGIDQPSISKILSGRLRGFSVDRLMQLLIALDQDVLITITPSELEGRGRILVQATADKT
jgi:predicted XRE-type DNA-binding protein